MTDSANTSTSLDLRMTGRDGLSQSSNDSVRQRQVNFSQVRERLDEQKQDGLPQFASRVRQYGHPSITSDVSDYEKSSKSLIACEVDGDYLEGAFHLVARLKFTDGLRWVIKIPANGHGDHFNQISRKALKSEALTMHIVQKETTVPVPEVHAFDASLENEIYVPYILMDQVDGSPLQKVWYKQDIPMSRKQHIRSKALRDLAAAMVQLRKFTFDRSGALDFNEDGTIRGVESAKAIDHQAMWDKDDETDHEETRHENYDMLYERGPFTDPKSFFTSMLERNQKTVQSEDARDNTHLMIKGNEVCLRLFIDWAFEKRDASGGRNDAQAFVLAHPDLDLHNIMVAEDGSLRGIIDWDGAAVVPREIGCAQYPTWLMGDWDTISYRWPSPLWDDGDREYCESSPDELACYRAMYAQFIELEVARTTKASMDSAPLSSLQKEEGDLTRRSLVMWALWLAVTIPPHKGNMVSQIYNQIEGLDFLESKKHSWSSTKHTSSDHGEHDQRQHEHKENDPDQCEKDHSENKVSLRGGYATADHSLSGTLATVGNSQASGVGRSLVGKTQIISKPLLNLAQNAPDRVLVENEASTNDSNSQAGSAKSSIKAGNESATDKSPPSTIRKEGQGPLGHDETNASKAEATDQMNSNEFYPYFVMELDETLSNSTPPSPTSTEKSETLSNKIENNNEHATSNVGDTSNDTDEEENEDKGNRSKDYTDGFESQKVDQRIYEDRGGFDNCQVMPLLARGELDEARMSWLKGGCLRVLETF